MYFGQIDPSTSKPCGLGVQIDEISNIQEGMFIDEDSLMEPYVNINPDMRGYKANFMTEDGKVYRIDLTNELEFLGGVRFDS